MALVQVHGGAVFLQKGELVFDSVAISDTNATARRPRTHTPVGPRLRAGAAAPLVDFKPTDFDLDSYKILVKPIMLQSVRLEPVAA